MSDKYLNIARDIILNIIDRENVTVFLFGSRADRNFVHNSDIDVGFLSNKKLDDTLFSKINEALDESIVPYHFDLVDFSKTDKRFRSIALNKIEIWNRAKDSNIN